MKKAIYFLVLFTVMASITPTLHAARDMEPRAILSKTSEAKKFILNLKGIKSKKVNCSIVSKKGEVLYFEEMSPLKVPAKSFDLSHLPMGDYTVTIEDELRIQKYTVTVGKDDIEIDNERQIAYKPMFRNFEQNVLGINMLNLGQKVELQIIKEEEVIHEHTFSDVSTVSKKYDLSTLRPGNYTFKITAGENVFYHHVRI